MTKVITRYFEDADQIGPVWRELVDHQRFPRRIMRVYTKSDGLAEALISADVNPETAAAYEKKMGNGGAVLLVRARYKPLGVGPIFRKTTDAMGAVDMGDLVEEVFIKDPLYADSKVLSDHPHIMSAGPDPYQANYYMANWPIPLISRRKPFDPYVFKRHAYMASWPIGHLIPGHKFMANFPFGHLIPGHKFMANFPFGHLIPGHKHQAGFPFGHIVPGHKHYAGFPFGHLIPGHKFMANFPFGHLLPSPSFMANWPFPHLINGKTGTNSLVPGQKFMAKFPFAHIVPGHKFMAKFPFAHIVPGHKFMAKFPFGHLIPGHKHQAGFPFGHIVPGHKHQADFPIPLLIKNALDPNAPPNDSFSLSKLLGIPTLIRR